LGSCRAFRELLDACCCPPPGGVVVLTPMDTLLSDFDSAKYLHSLGLRVNI